MGPMFDVVEFWKLPEFGIRMQCYSGVPYILLYMCKLSTTNIFVSKSWYQKIRHSALKTVLFWKPRLCGNPA